MSISKDNLNKISDYLWEIPQSFRSDMKVPARIYASEKMLGEIFRDRSLEQLINLTTLPGVQKYAIAMPDCHEGYGAPIGGVLATAIDKNGIISPGLVGYDINCGVRLLRSEKTFKEIQPYLEKLGQAIYAAVPSGVGKGGRIVLKGKDFDRVLEKGAKRAVEMGYGEAEDLKHLESEGMLENADASLVSENAKSRGRDQLGTMGAGNHFVEVEVVETIFDEEEARRLGIFKDQVVVLIHTGSRGLGHQIATDYIRVMMRVMPKYGISLPDRELACAPFNSPEGQNYFYAMAAGANFAWANRQVITWEVRKAWEEVLGRQSGPLNIVYDVAHNIAKIEEYKSDLNGGEKIKVVVHRKGATRSFPGQPVLIPGSMGTGSYLLVGQEKAMEESFGSTCHGAGRRMSRTQAKREIRGSELKQELNKRGIVVNTGSLSGLAEEAPEAYKDVEEVVEVVHRAGIAKKVARFKPIAVIKG
jgi:tRNA-splicing ligase RtcB